MKKDVYLNIKSKQYNYNVVPEMKTLVQEVAEEESVEIFTEGILYTKPEAKYITYEKSEQAGLEDVRTVLKVQDGSVRIRTYSKKDNEVANDIILQEGIVNATRYKVSMGASFSFEVYTNKIENNIGEDGYGTLSLDFDIQFDDAFTRRNILKIEVQALQ